MEEFLSFFNMIVYPFSRKITNNLIIILLLLFFTFNIISSSESDLDSVIKEFQMIEKTKKDNYLNSEINILSQQFKMNNIKKIKTNDNNSDRLENNSMKSEKNEKIIKQKTTNLDTFFEDYPIKNLEKDNKSRTEIDKNVSKNEKKSDDSNINSIIEESKYFINTSSTNTIKSIDNKNNKSADSPNKISQGIKFKEIENEGELSSKRGSMNHNSRDLTPDNLPKPNPPMKKLILPNEEIIPVQEINADTIYISYNKGNIFKRLDAKNLINNEDIWCSSGNHGNRDEIKIKFTFDSNYRMNALWLYWAFAPGEFRIQYSNDDKTFSDVFPQKFRLSEQNSSILWWKKIISNPITRWQHRSFDERIELENPFYVKQIVITMRIPVNKYFGLYSIEFYKKLKTVGMIKSRTNGRDNCLSVINGDNTSYSPLISSSCIDLISYGDNRDLFVLHSNNFITTFNTGLCLTSPNVDKLEVIDCSESEEYKDDRNKWIFEYNGLIRSKKNPGTCISVMDDSYRNYIESHALETSASSNLEDKLHRPEKVKEYYDMDSYWASALSVNKVIFQVLLHKFSALIKTINISWKFPAKKFTVYALLSNGYWKVIQKFSDNRESNNIIYSNNHDIKGIKIVMFESTTKFEEKNIYGINKIFFKIEGNFVQRQSCQDLLDNINKWEIIDITTTDISRNREMNRKFVELYSIELNLERITKTFEDVHESLFDITEKSLKINENLKKLDDLMEISKYKLTNFEGLLRENAELQKNLLGENKLFPANSCKYIKKAFPFKRSGFYWIRNECIDESLKMYCDFDPKKDEIYDYYIVYDKEKYQKKSNEEFFKKQDIVSKREINNENPIQNNKIDYFELRRMCTDIGLQPIEISNIRMLNIIEILIDEYDIYLGNEKELYGIPLGIDYDCTRSLIKRKKLKTHEKDCKENFQSLSTNKSPRINSIFEEYTNKNSKNFEMSNSLDIKGNSDENSDKKLNEVLKYLEYNEFFGFTSFNKLQKFSSLDTKVNAVICSTMKKSALMEKSALELKCKSNLNDLEDKIYMRNRNSNIKNQLVFNQEIAFMCPNNCGQIYNALVWGDGTYTDNSAICRAAIHSGILKDSEGGTALLVPTRGLDFYIGKKSNYIESLDYPEKWMRSFIIKKYTPHCPENVIIDLEDEKIAKVGENVIGKNITNINLLPVEHNNVENEKNKNDMNNNKKDEIKKRMNENKENIEKININQKLKKKNEEKKKSKELNMENLLNNRIDDFINENKPSAEKFNIENSDINKRSSDSKIFDFGFSSFVSIEENLVLQFLSKFEMNDSIEKKKNIEKIQENEEDEKKNNDKNPKKNLEILTKFLQYLKKNNNLKSVSKSNTDDISERKRNQDVSFFNLRKKNLQDLKFIQTELSSKNNLKDSPSKENLSEIDKIIGKLTQKEKDEMKKLEEKKKNSITKHQSYPISDTNKQIEMFKMTTDEALLQINHYIKYLRNQINDIFNFSEEFKKFVSQISSKIFFLKSDKKRGLKNQNLLMKSYLNKIPIIEELIEKIEMVSNARIIRSEFNIFLLKRKLGKLKNRDNFYEDYTNEDILTNFEIFNMRNSKGKSVWKYSKINLKGHNTVISQRSESQDNLIGSQLIILNRDFYDFELRFSANINSDGTFGIAFRHRDQFNFYVFEISRKDKGFKRVRKFINGAPQVIAFISDGGYLPEKWLTFKILAKNSNIRIYYTHEEFQNKDPGEIDKNLQLIFDIYDNEFIHGTVAFSSLLIDSLLIDDISIKQLTCTDYLNSSNLKLQIITDSCDKYFETFKHIFAYWEKIDPEKFLNGPSNWTRVSHFEDRDNVLAQLSIIYGMEENEEGTIFLLKNKICEKGFIKVKGKVPILEGRDLEEYTIQKKKLPIRCIGVVFKYKDYDNFYLLEIFNDSMIRFRKKIYGKFILISQNPFIGFEYDKWFKILVFIKNNHFSFRFFKDSNDPVYFDVFQDDLIDDDLKFGQVGLWTYKTKAYFSDFETFKFQPEQNGKIKNVMVNPLFIDAIENSKIKKETENKNPVELLLKNKGNIFKPPGKGKNDQLMQIASRLETTENRKADHMIKYDYILNQLNKNIFDYTWRNCLIHITPEKRFSHCNIISPSEIENLKCKMNFCPTCCNKFVGFDSKSKSNRYLCVKQCSIMSHPSDQVKIWNKCIIPDSYSKSFYNYCDKVFQFDNLGKTRCKVDMCRLCCVNVDMVSPMGRIIPQISEGLLKKCNDECIKYYDKFDAKQ